jgi:hypothetical protein
MYTELKKENLKETNRDRRRRKDIKMNLRETKFEHVDWIDLAQVRGTVGFL